MRSLFPKPIIAAALITATLGLATDLCAQNTLIPVTTRRDLVFDSAGKYLYITTSDGFVRPYNLNTGQLEAAYNLGGSLNGLDIAPNDAFLIVAQDNVANSQGRFHRVDLISGTITDIVYSFDDSIYSDGGGWDVVIGSNGLALATTGGGNRVPVRQIDLATNNITVRADVPGSFNNRISHHSAVHRSADRTRFYFLEPDIDSGPVFTYSATTNAFGPSVPSWAFLHQASAAVNRDGTLFGTRIADASTIDTAPGFHFEHSFHGADGGIAFDAVRDLFYAVNSSLDQIIAYDTNSFRERFRISIGENISEEPAQYDTSSLVACQDGRYLALKTPTGVRLLTVPATIPNPTPTPMPELTRPRGMVFSHSGNYLYISTASGFVHSYNVSTSQFENAYELGGSLNQIDIAPDDSYVLVAQSNIGMAEGCVHKLNLANGIVTNLNYLRAFFEFGAWDVVIGSNHRAFFSTQFLPGGSGWTPLHQINLDTNAVTTRSDVPGSSGDGQVRQNTLIYRSGDRTRFYFMESNIIAGPVFTYNALTDTFGQSPEPEQFWNNSGAAVNRNGTLVANGIGTGASLDTLPNFAFVRSFDGLDSGKAFDALSDTLYGVNSASDQVVAYDTNTFAELFRLDIGENLDAGIIPFGPGILIASHDGRHLALQVPSGIRVFDVSTATPSSAPKPDLATARGMVFDHSGKYLYIATSTGLVERYNISTGIVDVVYNVGGSLNGIDITPDDSALVIAQNNWGILQGTFHKIDLTTGKIVDIKYPRRVDADGTNVTGAWDVAIASNGMAFATTYGTEAPARQIDPVSNVISIRHDAPGSNHYGLIGGTGIHRSADGNRSIFFERSSAWPIFAYISETDMFGPSFWSNNFSDSGSAAVNRNGSLLCMRVGRNAFLRRLPDFNVIHTFGLITDSGVAFDAVKDILYAATSLGPYIIAYDTNTFGEIFRLNVGESLPRFSSRFGVGQLIASQDGHYLALKTPSTVRIFSVPPPAPLPTPIVSISVSATQINEGTSASFSVSASSNTARPVTINYSIKGKALFGADYNLSDNLGQIGQITIPVGADSAVVTLTAVTDHMTEKKETAIMTLSTGAGYNLAKPKKAKITILNGP